MKKLLTNRPVLLGVVMVALAVTAWASYRTYDYVQHDPEFCVNCHIMDDAFARWSSSVHSEITCHACHRPNLKDNINQLWVYLTDPPEAPRHKPEIENSVCYQCHNTEPRGPGPHDEHWRSVLREAGHKTHVASQKIQCIRCHSTSLHVFEPPEKICVECHKHAAMIDSGMVQHCTACHAFVAPERADLRPKREDCLQCHEHLQVHAEVFPEGGNGPMHWDCAACHKPHSKRFLATEDCQSCHAAQLEGSLLHDVASHGQCTSCHKPHSWKADPAACLDCHADREEHAAGDPCTLCHL